MSCGPTGRAIFLPDVLVTRPEPGASDTARRLTERGHTPVLAPMLTVAPRALGLLPHAQAIVVTSGNSLSGPLPDVPLFAVGDATAAKARALGLTHVTSAGRDAATLAKLVVATCDPGAGPLLLLSGEGHGLDLAATLRGHRFRVVRRVAYATAPVATLPPQAARMLRSGAGHALFFSPQTARVFARLLAASPAPVDSTEAIAISPATAAALAPLPWARIRVASHPNQDAMLALLP